MVSSQIDAMRQLAAGLAHDTTGRDNDDNPIVSVVFHYRAPRGADYPHSHATLTLTREHSTDVYMVTDDGRVREYRER